LVFVSPYSGFPTPGVLLMSNPCFYFFPPRPRRPFPFGSPSFFSRFIVFSLALLVARLSFSIFSLPVREWRLPLLTSVPLFSFPPRFFFYLSSGLALSDPTRKRTKQTLAKKILSAEHQFSRVLFFAFHFTLYSVALVTTLRHVGSPPHSFLIHPTCCTRCKELKTHPVPFFFLVSFQPLPSTPQAIFFAEVVHKGDSFRER